MALDGHLLANQHTTTSLKQTVAAEGTIEGRRDKLEAPGKRVIIIFGGGKVKCCWTVRSSVQGGAITIYRTSNLTTNRAKTSKKYIVFEEVFARYVVPFEVQ